MYVLKGFITHALFANNAVGAVGLIGEISTLSLTFSREKGTYTSAAAPDLTLTSFLSAKDDVVQIVPSEFSNHVLAVSKYVYDTTLNGNTQIFAAQLLESLLTNFAASAEEFACGEIVTDGQFWVPEWVSWKAKSINGYATNTIKVWLCDANFQNQYDEYEIVVVPPFDTLVDFFRPGASVDTRLSALTDSGAMERIQSAKQGYPETIIRTDTYDYVDPNNANHRVPSNWSVLIYGAAGNNVDAVKDALQAYILANSTQTREQWKGILPDIFSHTEYLMVPMYNQYAIPNRGLQTGIYSNIANLKDALALIVGEASNYPEAHINENASVMGHPYKSMAITVVGSQDNKDGKYRITDVFPDYIAVSSTSVDFNRMSQNTQTWMLLLEQMLITAEMMGDFTSIPLGMSKVTREGKLYLVKHYGNANYLVSAKKNFPVVSPL